MHRSSYYIINGITLYRVVAAIYLCYLALTGQIEIFKWVLAFSFFTDAIDGILARRYRVTSIIGAKLDSIGDDLTVIMGIFGLFLFRNDFIQEQWPVILALVLLFLLQFSMALLRYGKFTAYHTYLAKGAALFQGSFLILSFFLPQCPLVLFYIAATITMLDLIEEIALVLLLPEWKANVKGLLWISKVH